MTTPLIAIVLGLIHVTLLATAILVLRACVPRRLAGSRAAIGGVGMACIVAVTALALLPLPSIWPNFEASPAAAFAPAVDQNSGKPNPNGQDIATKAPSRRVRVDPSTGASGMADWPSRSPGWETSATFFVTPRLLPKRLRTAGWICSSVFCCAASPWTWPDSLDRCAPCDSSIERAPRSPTSEPWQ